MVKNSFCFSDILYQMLFDNSKVIISREKKCNQKIIEKILRLCVFLKSKNKLIEKLNILTLQNKNDTLFQIIIQNNKSIYYQIGLNSILMLNYLIEGDYFNYYLIYYKLKTLKFLNTYKDKLNYSKLLEDDKFDLKYLEFIILIEQRLLKSMSYFEFNNL